VIAGYAVSLGDPTAVQTALALRQAIWRKSDPQWPGVRDTGDPVQRPRCGFHQRPHRPGLHRPQRSADPPRIPRGRGKIVRASSSACVGRSAAT